MEKPRQVRKILEQFKAEYERAAPKLNIPMFDFMAEQLIKINRAIQQPYSSVLLVGAPGLGKAALSRLAVHTCRYERHELSPTVEFGPAAWRLLLREMTEAAVTDSRAQVLDLSGGRVVTEGMLEDLSCLLKTGQLPGLFQKTAWQNLVLEVKTSSALAADRGDGAKRPQPSPGPDVDYVLELMARTRRHIKIILSVCPTAALLTDTLRRFPTILSASTIIWVDDWPEEGIRDVAKKYVRLLAEHSSGPEPQSADGPGIASASSSPLSSPRNGLVDCALRIHRDMQNAVKSYSHATGHQVMATPLNFVGLMETLVDLHKQRTEYYEQLRTKYDVGLDQIRKTEEHVCTVQRRLDGMAPVLVEK